VKYEKVLKNPDREVSAILKFLGLNTGKNGCIQIASRFNVLHKNVNSQPIIDRCELWKDELNKNEVIKFESIAYKDLKNEGYQVSYSIIVLILYRIYSILKSIGNE